MGTIVSGKCNCGYEIKFLQGGGMMNFKIMDAEPAYCEHCRVITIENFKQKHLKCEKCGKPLKFYNDPSLSSSESAGQKKSLQWSEFYLPMNNNLCPKCGKMSLEFKSDGCWD